MRRALGFLLRDSLVYGVAGAANRFVKILLLPVVARAFPTEAFGAFDAVGVYVYILAVAGILGLNSAVVIVATRGGATATPEIMRGPAAMSLRMTVAVSLLLSAVFLLAPGWWSAQLLGTRDYASAISWGAASVPFSAVLIYLLSLLQWGFRRTWYVTVALGSALLTIVLSYLVAFHSTLGLNGLFAANLVGQAAGAAVAGYACRDMLRGTWDSRRARELLAIGLPFAVIALASNLVPSVDRIFLVQSHSLADAGIYGLGQKIAALSSLILAGFQAAWGPFAFSQRSAPGKPGLFGRVFLLVCSLAAYLAVVLAVSAPFIARIIATEEYASAAIFVGPLALSAGLGAVFFVVAIGSVLEGKSLHNLVAYGAGLGATVLLNLLLAQMQAPPIGIAWANFAGQAIAVVCMTALAQRVHPVPYPMVPGAVVLLAAIPLCMLGAQAGGPLTTLQLAGVVAAITIAFFAWLWLAVLDSRDRRRVLQIIAARPGGTK
ncbi:MAG TPA: oligosaccharide flippase family protein [Gemmatimonadales bacterium]|nr:oligosaccharide flippase family protein [Gemmatimonadales bacterium]